MEQCVLDKDMISQPELWRLVLLLSPERLDVALYPPVVREQMVWHSIMLDSGAQSPLKALEDAVYGNPLLLNDFKKVDCLVDYGGWMMVPSEADETDVVKLMNVAGVANDGCADVECYDAGAANARVALMQPRDIKSFLTRTFFNIRFDSRMASLCRYLIGHTDGLGQCRAYAFIRGERLTFIAVDGERLLAANEFEARTATDIAYYVLASMQELKLGLSDTDVAVHGDGGVAARESIDILKRYADRCLPMPFPILRYRPDKSTMQAPFDLLIRPLCE